MPKSRVLLFTALLSGLTTLLMVLLLALFVNTTTSIVPLWVVVLLFFFSVFGLFYGAAYFILKRRVLRIKRRVLQQGIALSEQQISKSSSLFELERTLEDLNARQSSLVDELKSREQFRREYIGNVSHELKTPIFNIQGYIYTLLDGAITDEKVAKKFLRRAAKSVERMTQLVKDMDVLTKVESGEYDIQIRPVRVRTLIDDALEEIENLAAKRKSKIKLDFDIDSKTQVYCDAARLEQVLDNLLVNGIKYSDEGSTVHLSVSGVQNKVEFRIKDHGFGISEADLPHIFERFYRVDKARSRDAGGTGLGLSIVKHIIDRHGERIQVQSKEGVGTEFIFTLKRV